MKRFDRRVILNWFLGGSTFAWMGSVLHPVISFLMPPPEQEAAVSSVKAATLTEMAAQFGQDLQVRAQAGVDRAAPRRNVHRVPGQVHAPRLRRAISRRQRADLVRLS